VISNRSTNQGNSIGHSKEEVLKAFTDIAMTIESALGSPSLDHYTNLSFMPISLQLTGPRFGVKEYKDDRNRFILELSQDLLTRYSKYLEPILWREAYLLHLPTSIRQVSQAADLGLYCYYRYALRTKKQRNQFLQIWQTISPPIDYAFYRYYPTAGFAYFDNLVDGTFLIKVKDWFKPFSQLSTPMSTETYTESLERWMFNYHRMLRPIELKILQGLNECLTCSQIEIAEKLKLRQPTISQVIKRLAEKHLLRFIIFVNYPKLGLQPTTVSFTSTKMSTIESLLQLISKIRYSLAIQEFDNQLLASFLIPTERMTRFRQWLRQVASSLDLSLPEVRLISERMHARNLNLYAPSKGGWSPETESLLENFSRLISEKLTSHLPAIKFFKLAPPHTKKTITIKQQDFIYMHRATDAYLATRHMKFFESQELRQAGYKESEHMAYRRRVKYLEKNEIISPPLGIGLLNIGLNSVIYLYLGSLKEETKRIFSACQLFPHVSCMLFDDGTGVATLPVPSSIAVSLKTSIESIFTTIDIPAVISIKPAWKAYGWTGPYTVDSVNYDFEKSRWIWTKDTLPAPRI
jgi:DNA-binding Lrp family transcriptional regulator